MPAAAEGESMLAAEAEAERDSMREEEDEEEEEDEDVAWERRMCRFRDCLCRWEHFSPTPRVAPGIDYVRTPDDAAAAADCHLPAWSLLVGVTDGASALRVSRLRVAQSGRILGRSDDVLGVFHNIVLAKPPGYSFQAGVAPLPAADGLSLCVLHTSAREQPQALQLALHPHAQPADDAKASPLPGIEGTTIHCTPVSVDGNIWALSAGPKRGDINSFSAVARRLLPDEPGGGGRRWELVHGSPFTSPLLHRRSAPWKGAFLQGYAVIPDHKLILVSFQQYGLFLTFAPDTGTWARVLTHTDERRSQRYLPIFGRGVYVEQHKAVCMLLYNVIYAYKLTYHTDDQGTQQLKLELPVKIGKICPFTRDKGYGFLTRLAGSLMCSVWISLASHDPCPCDNLHAIVTTFNLHELAEEGIKVLHTTYRRIDMVPNPHADQEFCFLQEYEDRGSLVLQQRGEEQEDVTSSQHVDKPSKTLSCCRNILDRRLILSRHQVCSSGPVVRIPVPVKPATTTTKKDLFIICQAGSGSVIYQTGAMDDDVKPLEPWHVADVGDHYWHFFQSGSKIQAVSSIRDGMLEFSLNKDILKRPVRRPTAGPFVMVIRVGRETIAVTETLQVYHQTQFNYGSIAWLRYTTDETDVVPRRVDISGYVAVNDDSFIVCDAVTCSCLLFDLGTKQWRVVMPLDAFKEDLSTTVPKNGFLKGRCVFVDGFIYTCRNGGLAAYELLGEDHSVYLSKPIFLPLSQLMNCLGEDMCLDYAGKDVDSGDNLFYLVQGEYSPPRHGLRINTVSITTAKVKTRRTASNKMKPAGIDHVGSVRRSVYHTEAINTSCCFAVS